MPKGQMFPRELDPIVARMYADGTSVIAIANFLHVEHKCIANSLKRSCVPIKIGRPKEDRNILDLEEVRRLYVDEELSCESIAKKLGSNFENVRDFIHANNIKMRRAGGRLGHGGRHKVYTVDDHFFDILDTEEKCYWIGFLTADGYVYKNRISTELAMVDYDHLLKFQKSLNASYPVVEIKKYGARFGKTAARFDVVSYQLSESVRKHGLLANKSTTAKAIEDLPEHLVRHYLRGLFDGDGSVFVDRAAYGVSMCGTESITSFFAHHMENRFGCRHKIKSHPNKLTTWEIRQSFYFAYQILDYLYKDSTVYLDRKYKMYRGLIKRVIAKGGYIRPRGLLAHLPLIFVEA